MSIFSKFSSRFNKDKEEAAPDIRYSDPSHDPKNRTPRTTKAPNIKSQPKPSVQRYKRPERDEPKKKRLTPHERRDLVNAILNAPNIKELTSEYVERYQHENNNTILIKRAVASKILGNKNDAESIIESSGKVSDYLYGFLNQLRDEKLIGFNHKRKAWHIVKGGRQEYRELSDREKRYLWVKGVNPEGYVCMADANAVIEYIYRTLSPDQFEQLSCAFFEHLDGRDVTVTEKRASGADGGIDGSGYYTVDEGHEVPFFIQAKKYKPSSQIGEDTCQKLCGAIMKYKGVKHGVIVTTGRISERSCQYVRDLLKNHGIEIAFVDQDKMIEIMKYRDIKMSHGLGIYRSEDYNMHYVNFGVIEKAAGKA
ncbi:MAG: restriction endonuclease [Alphaproteobacteria bacterium]